MFDTQSTGECKQTPELQIYKPTSNIQTYIKSTNLHQIYKPTSDQRDWARDRSEQMGIVRRSELDLHFV